jgi:ATP-dependent protease ClpP protease subunit
MTWAEVECVAYSLRKVQLNNRDPRIVIWSQWSPTFPFEDADYEIMGRTTASMFFVALALVTLFSASATADSIVLRSGRTVQGDVTAEDEQTITVEVSSPNGAIENRIQKAQIVNWNRERHEGPPYVVIPVLGEIGLDPTADKFVSADAFQAGLEAAYALHPRYIVLAIDSPGGSISELDKMLEVLGRAPADCEVIAYVKTAYSAAAVLAMSCRRIYIRPLGVIGACVPFDATDGVPEDVNAKFRSALEASQRALIVQAGHDGLFLMGMAELDTEIYLTHEGSKPVLSSAGPGKLIKPKGQILTLTADEAQNCGLAHVINNISEIGQDAAGGPWFEASKRPWDAVVGVSEREHRKFSRGMALERIKPALADLNSQIQTLATRWNGDRSAVIQMYEQYQNRQISAAQYQQTVAPYQADAAAINGEISALAARRKQLIDSLPN